MEYKETFRRPETVFLALGRDSEGVPEKNVCKYHALDLDYNIGWVVSKVYFCCSKGHPMNHPFYGKMAYA